MPKNLVYVGTYTRAGRSEGIYVFRRDPATGALARAHVARSPNPSFLAFDPTGRRLYAVNEMLADDPEGKRDGAMSAFAVDPESGALTFLNQESTHGTYPCHLVVDPTGACVLAANYGSGSVAVFPIEADGRLRPASQVLQHAGSGPHPRQRGPHAHATNLDPAGQRILVADLGLDRVLVYRLDAAAGELVPNDPPGSELHPGAGPRHIAFHPSGRWVFVNGELDSTVSVFAYDGATGALRPVQGALSTLPAGVDGAGNTTAEVVVHPSGRWVYVSNRGHDSVAVFAVDEATGRLTAVGHQSTGGKTPRNVAVDPEGAYLYAANQNSDNVVQFRIDQRSGMPEPTGHEVEAPGAVCILFA